MKLSSLIAASWFLLVTPALNSIASQDIESVKPSLNPARLAPMSKGIQIPSPLVSGAPGPHRFERWVTIRQKDDRAEAGISAEMVMAPREKVTAQVEDETLTLGSHLGISSEEFLTRLETQLRQEDPFVKYATERAANRIIFAAYQPDKAGVYLGVVKERPEGGLFSVIWRHEHTSPTYSVADVAAWRDVISAFDP